MTLKPIPVKWKNCVNHLGDSSNCDSILQGGLLPGGISGKWGRQACHFSALNPQCDMDKSDQYNPVQPEVLQPGSCKHTWAKYNLRDRLGDRTKSESTILSICEFSDVVFDTMPAEPLFKMTTNAFDILIREIIWRIIPNITRLIWAEYCLGRPRAILCVQCAQEPHPSRGIGLLST